MKKENFEKFVLYGIILFLLIVFSFMLMNEKIMQYGDRVIESGFFSVIGFDFLIGLFSCLLLICAIALTTSMAFVFAETYSVIIECKKENKKAISEKRNEK